MPRTVTVVALLGGIALVGAIVLFSGTYNIGATEQHTRPMYWLLDLGMRRSVDTHSKTVVVPPLSDRALVQRGSMLYRAHCMQCHGGPGVGPEPFALGLIPAPANLVHTARDWPPEKLYWVVKNGIKMTGMPAWEFRLSDGDLWSVVAFLRELPQIEPRTFVMAARNTSAQPVRSAEDPAMTPPDVRRGKRAIDQYACATCHWIPGVVGATAPVGPPLDRLASRTFIGGVVKNTRENMIRWLRDPPALAPGTAMPNLGVSERDARDMAAYLYTLD